MLILLVALGVAIAAFLYVTFKQQQGSGAKEEPKHDDKPQVTFDYIVLYCIFTSIIILTIF